METSAVEHMFCTDASTCSIHKGSSDVSTSTSLPYLRVGQSMASSQTPILPQTMDRSLSTPELQPEVWCVSSKPTIQDSEPDVNVLSGDNRVDVGIRPELDNIRVNLCSCLVSVECCSR